MIDYRQELISTLFPPALQSNLETHAGVYSVFGANKQKQHSSTASQKELLPPSTDSCFQPEATFCIHQSDSSLVLDASNLDRELQPLSLSMSPFHSIEPPRAPGSSRPLPLIPTGVFWEEKRNIGQSHFCAQVSHDANITHGTAGSISSSDTSRYAKINDISTYGRQVSQAVKLEQLEDAQSVAGSEATYLSLVASVVGVHPGIPRANLN